MTEEYRLEADDQLVREERAAFIRACDDLGSPNAAREVLKQQRRERYTAFIKTVKTSDTIQKLTWEDQLDKLGFKVIRNETVFDGEGFTFYRGENKNKPCLCKVYTSKDYLKRYNIASPDRVAGIMLRLNYPRIQKLIAAFEITQINKMYYFGETIVSTLQAYFRTNRKPLGFGHARTWFQELVSGLLYLHNMGIAHRHLTLDAVYMKSETGDLQLSCPDSLAETFTSDVTNDVHEVPVKRPTHKRTSLAYEQMFSDEPNYDPLAADVWQLGTLLYYFRTLVMPFATAKSKREMQDDLKMKRWSFIGVVDTNPRLDDETKGMLEHIFVDNAERRPILQELIVNQYLSPLKLPPPLPAPVLLPPAPPPAEAPPPWVPPPIIPLSGERGELEYDTEAYREYMRIAATPQEGKVEWYNHLKRTRFAKFIERFNKEPERMDKVTCEEVILERGFKITRKTLIQEDQNSQFYESSVHDRKGVVKVTITQNYQSKYRIKNVGDQVKMLFLLNACPLLVSILNVFLIQNKTYFFFDLPVWYKLATLIREKSPLPINQCRQFARQLSDVLVFLHGQGIAHNNMEPNHIFVNEERDQLKVGYIESAVFGFDVYKPGAVLMQPKRSARHIYMAPECMFQDSYDPFPADVWSITAILYYAMYARPPFEMKNHQHFTEQIEQVRWLQQVDRKFAVDEQTRQMFGLVFVDCPEKRLISFEFNYLPFVRNTNGTP